ncbi:hypothetical protein H310_04072 [Aphanomyces invadans]|uniref:Tc1-like transposase DDE domain-containing protein n=1 Tax=Aphanomyces invadans TaxID=157072 RepID=A0A024UFQ0_9STRA|nr:hypothetical protein H310_04072 [Aphanomyces invadans]ETW05020.1 hypothetical protein H310_04072 [Aphanomyces invadans]|eukprot:XP_008866458.1 hypothetical protein H310_04072 [Aphanomyces invadans]
MTKVKRKFYVYEDEEMAQRSAKHKNHITKDMYLAAVTRPRYDYKSRRFFDGKLGIWPIVEDIVAQRSSKNGQKLIMDKVVPAIATKFPRSYHAKTVFLQQDNASPHCCITSEYIRSKGYQYIEVAKQLANSPDFNVLDLG